MASRTADRQPGPVEPREALRVALVGGGAGLVLASLVWLALAGTWFVTAPGRDPPSVLVGALELEPLGFGAGVTAVVAGYLGLVVGAALTAVGTSVRDPTGGGVVPDLGVPELTRRRILFDASLSVLAAAGAVSVLVVVPATPWTLDPISAAFLLRLVLIVECGVLVARLWDPLVRHSRGARRVDDAYDRVHDWLEAVPDRRPATTVTVRRLAVAGTLLGVPAIGGALVLLELQPGVVVRVVGLGAWLAVPTLAVAGVLPAAGTAERNPRVRAQRTLVVLGWLAAVPGVVLTTGLFVAFAGSVPLGLAYVSPLPTTPVDALVIGWALVLVGYAWRTRDGIRAAVGDGQA